MYFNFILDELCIVIYYLSLKNKQYLKLLRCTRQFPSNNIAINGCVRDISASEVSRNTWLILEASLPLFTLDFWYYSL